MRWCASLSQGGCLNIVMEYATAGELSSVIQKRAREKKPFQEEEIMFWQVGAYPIPC